MTKNMKKTLFVSAADAQRLQALIDSHASRLDAHAVETLADELTRASLLTPKHVPPNVVTMNSHVVYQDETSGVQHELTLVYPRDADPPRRRISVLAPVGTALLGLLVGQRVEWRLPSGLVRRFRVLSIPYQPEASGDFHL